MPLLNQNPGETTEGLKNLALMCNVLVCLKRMHRPEQIEKESQGATI